MYQKPRLSTLGQPPPLTSVPPPDGQDEPAPLLFAYTLISQKVFVKLWSKVNSRTHPSTYSLLLLISLPAQMAKTSQPPSSSQTHASHPQAAKKQVQPSTLNPQPSTLNPQPSTLDPQPSSLNPQPSNLKPQPSTLNLQPSTPSPNPEPPIKVQVG